MIHRAVINNAGLIDTMDLFNDTMNWLRRMGRPDLADRIQTRLVHTDFFGT